MSAAAADVATMLRMAYAEGAIVGPICTDAAVAGAIRDANIATWLQAGRRVVGRKIGLTGAAVRAALAAPGRSDGVLFDDMAIANGGTVASGRLLQPLVEGEIGVILRSDVSGDEDTPSMLAAIAGAVAAIELPDSRIADWAIRYPDAVADNGSAGAYAIAGAPCTFDALATFAWTLELCRGGVRTTSSGELPASEILDNLHWLARTAADQGRPLRAGELVLTGAASAPVPMASGDTASFVVAGLTPCSISFS